jgi:hypothetical protein
LFSAASLLLQQALFPKKGSADHLSRAVHLKLSVDATFYPGALEFGNYSLSSIIVLSMSLIGLCCILPTRK